MAATQKVESKNEETWERSGPGLPVTTNPGKKMAKLGQQIAKVMATLTKTRQGSSPSSVPGSLWQCEQPSHQTPTMVGVAWARQPQPAAYQQSVG